MYTLFWRVLVIIFISLGVIGALLPVMPTTVFLILALWASAKGWPEMHQRLIEHPRYGKSLRQWRDYGIVMRNTKWIASGFMLCSGIVLCFTPAPFLVKIFTNAIMLGVAIWLWLRPEQLPEVELMPLADEQQLRKINMNQPDIVINIAKQSLIIMTTGETFLISTAKNGIGELEGTNKTPKGWHQVIEKIGDDAPINSVFVARQATGEIYSERLALLHPKRDWILSRILRLSGLESLRNHGLNNAGELVDSYQRYIYIHATPDSEPMGVPLSHGCIRMRNQDIISLYQQIDLKSVIQIVAS